MLLAACVCADFYEILPKDPKTGSLKLLSATSYMTQKVEAGGAGASLPAEGCIEVNAGGFEAFVVSSSLRLVTGHCGPVTPTKRE